MSVGPRPHAGAGLREQDAQLPALPGLGPRIGPACPGNGRCRQGRCTELAVAVTPRLQWSAWTEGGRAVADMAMTGLVAQCGDGSIRARPRQVSTDGGTARAIGREKALVTGRGKA